MTFKEKWIQEHPGEEFNYRLIKCPHRLGYEPHTTDRGCNHLGLDCQACWELEIPAERDFNEEMEKMKKIATESFISAIKDSGDRTQFETGAVRDMREGKGRCDLMPLEVAARVFFDPVLSKGDYDINLDDIKKFQSTGETCYLYYVLRRFARKQYDCYESMLLEVAKHFEEGAKKYGENNWQKGIPVHCYIDSAVRHYLKWLRGDKDEPHDRAFVWNLMCCIWEVDYHKGG